VNRMPTNLLQEFPPVSTATWEKAICKDLKGSDYARKLVWQTDEGLAVKPYYRAEDIAGLEYLDAAPGSFPYVRGSRPTGNWLIREEIDEADLAKANQTAQRAVAAGAEEISFLNVVISGAADLEILLAHIQNVPVHFQDCGDSLLRLLLEKRILSPVSTGRDPLSNLDLAAQTITKAVSTFVPFTVRADEFEESGATTVQEVGFSLAAGVDFLAEMQARNVDVNRAVASLTFSFAIGSNFFFQIAKLRAFRLLWARAVESFGGTREAAKSLIHARTSRWNKTIYDPHVNILRATTEAMAAAIGGADSISVAPFDECYEASTEATRRLARNTQILLKHEASVSRVADAGGGSYSLEIITDFIVREGWKIMQEIEAAGGYRKARESGQIARALQESLAFKEKAVVSRRKIFTGTSQHADVSEKALHRIDITRVNGVKRGAQPFEQLRLRTERHAAQTGKTPNILLAEIGDMKIRAARSNFAANFFACAGFDMLTKQYDNVNDIAAVDSDLIVLCSSDPEYGLLAPELIAKLKALGRKTPVIVAGNPDAAEQLKFAGVADFVHVRSNAVEMLTKWQAQLGIKD
jgi:methylmalonyl-CoA mutase